MQTDMGKLLLRIMLGGLMLFHGIGKLSHGIDFVKGTLTANGLPEMMAYGVYVGEIIAPLMLLIGFKSRIAGAIIAFNMIMALFLVHSNELLRISDTGGLTIELQLFYLFSSIAIILLGSGKYAVKRD
ncbi:putative DoxX family protein [Sulfurovum sp. enrichment culture clone C5]|uniref:Putative DoxX family protein n=1 Tax=Sulfurovum sp. enrichment culture clone C5 TaxID=497650 RepID=A0A0S4XPQ4_9BACT|nr:putative DoxX family protein [Sulfurovum sp. enrichment culture clone C5]